MNTFKPNRRQFIKGVASTIAAPSFSGLLSNAVFAGTDKSNHTVITLFLRGAMDSLSAIVPTEENVYFDARPNTAVPTAGQINLNGQFALNSAMEALHDIYTQGDLAFVTACGLGEKSSTRSHFVAQRKMEAGTDALYQTDGWLGRYLSATITNDNQDIRAIGIGNGVQQTLKGYQNKIDTMKISDLNIRNFRADESKLKKAFSHLYLGADHLLLRKEAAKAVSFIEAADRFSLGSLPKPDAYGKSAIGNALHGVAELMIADAGLAGITVDMSGWDLHRWMGKWDKGAMRNQLFDLSTALAAFYNETHGLHNNMTVVVMSEFGRRVAQNNSGGTDHGKGGAMMVLGAGINGGKIYGDWPGLDDLDDGDLKITTDYRQILSELVAVRLGNPNLLPRVFPGYSTDKYLGIF